MTRTERPVSAIGRGPATETAASMKVCVTGATGFLGAHVVAMLARRGDDVRVTVRDRRRLRALEGLDVEVVDADVLDRRAMRRALAGCDVLFHTAGAVASRPYNRVWRVNAVAPRIAVEEAARAGVGRVVVTSSVASIGPAPDGRAATERNPYPPGGTGLLYTDSKHEGEAAALGAAERVGPRRGVGVSLLRPGAGATTAACRARPRRGSSPTTCAAACPRSSTPTRTSSTSRTLRRGTCWPPKRAGRASATSSVARTCAGPRWWSGSRRSPVSGTR